MTMPCPALRMLRSVHRLWPRLVPAGRRSSRGNAHPEHLGHRTAECVLADGREIPFLVQRFPKVAEELRRSLPAIGTSAGLRRPLHRVVRLGEIVHCATSSWSRSWSSKSGRSRCSTSIWFARSLAREMRASRLTHSGDVNIRCIGYVASQIVKYGGLAVAAGPIAPNAARAETEAASGRIEPVGGFVLVHVDTPAGGLRAVATARGSTPRRGIEEHQGFARERDLTRTAAASADAELAIDTTAPTVPTRRRWRIVLHLDRRRVT